MRKLDLGFLTLSVNTPKHFTLSFVVFSALKLRLHTPRGVVVESGAGL
jgi:hypothetical protein